MPALFHFRNQRNPRFWVWVWLRFWGLGIQFFGVWRTQSHRSHRNLQTSSSFRRVSSQRRRKTMKKGRCLKPQTCSISSLASHRIQRWPSWGDSRKIYYRSCSHRRWPSLPLCRFWCYGPAHCGWSRNSCSIRWIEPKVLLLCINLFVVEGDNPFARQGWADEGDGVRRVHDLESPDELFLWAESQELYSLTRLPISIISAEMATTFSEDIDEIEF